jgi:hypothetical protein
MRFPLQRVNRLPDVCYSQWRLSNDAVEEHPMSIADYKALGQPGAGPPVNPTGDPGAVWLKAGARDAYDTVDGQLAPGQVAEWGHGPDYCNDPGPSAIVIGLPNTGRLHIRRADILSGSKDNVSALTLRNIRRAGVTVVNGELNVEEAIASHS